jgi:signal transduction histidine kinase
VVLTHQVGYGVAPAVAASTVIPLAFARKLPMAGWGISVVLGVLFGALVEPQPGHQLPWTVPHVIVLFTLAVASSLVEPLWRVAVVWLGSAVVFAVLMPPDYRGGLVLGVTAAMVVGLLLRWLILSRLQLAHQEEVSELERARRAVLEERSRIARDLHDVVAHRMSLVVVQAQSAPARLGSVPAEVSEEFTSISEQAREALNEVRGMLGVLRSEDTTAASAPQQGTRDVEPLLRQTREAGVDLTWTVDGDPTTVAAAVGMVVYRILQEALANASRHAPGSRIEAALRYGDPVQVTIRSGPAAGASAVGGRSGQDENGPGRAAVRGPGTDEATHQGTGIIGMADRARSVGGTLDAHPLPDGGFLVRARLPPTVRAPH